VLGDVLKENVYKEGRRWEGVFGLQVTEAMNQETVFSKKISTIAAIVDTSLMTSGLNYFVYDSFDELYTRQALVYQSDSSDVEYKNGEIDGKVIEYYQGAKIREVFFEKGILNGLGITYYGGGERVKETGMFTNGQPDSLWVFNPDRFSEDRVEAFFDNGSLHGDLTVVDYTGNKLVVPFNNGMIDGREKMVDGDGETLRTREYREGKRWDGLWFYPEPTQIKTTFFEFVYEDVGYSLSDADGLVVPIIDIDYHYEDYEEGSKSIKYMNWGGVVRVIVSYENGQPNGQKTTFASNGETVIEQGDIVDGKPNGLWTYYYDDGTKKQERVFENGIRNGTYTLYHHDDHSKSYECHYVNGFIEGTCRTYYEGGALVSREVNFVGGEENGISIYYREDGSKSNENYWVSGELNGPDIYYWPDESVSTQGERKDSVRDGEWIWYGQDGAVFYREFWNNGVITESDLAGAWQSNNNTYVYNEDGSATIDGNIGNWYISSYFWIDDNDDYYGLDLSVSYSDGGDTNYWTIQSLDNDELVFVNDNGTYPFTKSNTAGKMAANWSNTDSALEVQRQRFQDRYAIVSAENEGVKRLLDKSLERR